MENFTKIDIFDTKGIEYILVIGYLLVLIVFWNISGKQVTKKIKKVLGNLSANLLRIPQGLFLNKNHTWAHLELTGAAKVGLDDFLQHVTGEVTFTDLKKPGEIITKGEILAGVEKDGKNLRVFSPISGEILNTNQTILDNPEIVNEDPYQEGWIYKIKPSNWVEETASCYFAEDATNWSKREMVRFKDFLMAGSMRKFSSEPSMILLQDGGEIRDHILAELPNEVWKEFQNEFLDFDHSEN